jgi:hypothetical protein
VSQIPCLKKFWSLHASIHWCVSDPLSEEILIHASIHQLMCPRPWLKKFWSMHQSIHSCVPDPYLKKFWYCFVIK